MGYQTSYIATARREDSASEAVVVHCSDHRFQNGFREFVTDRLKIGSFALLAVPGGGHFVSLEPYMPKFAKSNLQSISFLVKRTGARRIVLIGHDDCLFFRDRAEFLFAGETFNQKQIANLREARNRLREQFPLLAVETYFADSILDGSLVFDKVG